MQSDPSDKTNPPKTKQISIEEFSRVEMRVGKVVAATYPEKSEKLIRLVVDFGPSVGSGQTKPLFLSAEGMPIGAKIR